MGQVKSSGCIKQRGLIDCQLKFLVCFTRITKRGTMLSHLHPVETGRALIFSCIFPMWQQNTRTNKFQKSIIHYLTSNTLSVTFQIPVIANIR